MPVYVYSCQCGKSTSRTLPVSRCTETVRCSCKRRMERDFVKEHSGTVHNYEATWPVLSDAAGVHPKDIAAARVKSLRDGVPTDFTTDGRVVFRTPQHKRAYLKSIGMFDKSAYY